MRVSGSSLVSRAAVIVLSIQTASAGWSMTQLPAKDRARACQEQVSLCYNVCGSVAATEANFCNIRTMGWDCLCKGKGISFPEYEWPIAVAECRAALSACTHRCTAKQDGHERAKCFTSCTADYQCSTPDAPRSSLRVHGLYDKPAGYSPPTDDADVELSIGMKFGQDLSDLDAKFKKMQASNDPNALPKSIPRLEDAENAERDSLSSKGRDTLDDNDDGQGRKLKRPNGADRLLPSDMFSMGTGLLAIHSLVALLVRQPIQ